MLIPQTGTSTLYCSFIIEEDFQREYTEVGTPDYYSFQDIVRKEVGETIFNQGKRKIDNFLFLRGNTYILPFIQHVFSKHQWHEEFTECTRETDDKYEILSVMGFQLRSRMTPVEWEFPC